MPKSGERLPWKVSYLYRQDRHGNPCEIRGKIACFSEEEANRRAEKIRELGGEVHVWNADDRKRRA